MIKVEFSETEMDGTAAVLMGEVTYAIYHVCNAVAENRGVTFEQIRGELMKALDMVIKLEKGEQ